LAPLSIFSSALIEAEPSFADTSKRQKAALDCKDGRVKAAFINDNRNLLPGSGDCKNGRVNAESSTNSSELTLIAKDD